MHKGLRWLWGSQAVGTRIAWGVFAAVAALAGIRAASAVPSPAPAEPNPETARRIFEAMAAGERAARDTATQHFPADAWSQDDDFHAAELQNASRIGAQHGASLGQVLRIIDDGLRERWPRADSMTTKVVPCRPRPVY